MVSPPVGCTWRHGHMGWDHRDWELCSLVGGWDWESFPRDICKWVHLLVGYTWIQVHKGLGHMGSSWELEAGMKEWVQDPSDQRRCWHTRQNNRGPSLDSRGQEPPRTSRWSDGLYTGLQSGARLEDRWWLILEVVWSKRNNG